MNPTKQRGKNSTNIQSQNAVVPNSGTPLDRGGDFGAHKGLRVLPAVDEDAREKVFKRLKCGEREGKQVCTSARDPMAI